MSPRAYNLGLRLAAAEQTRARIISAARDLCNEGTFGTDGWLALLGAAIVIAIFAPLAVRKYRTHT